MTTQRYQVTGACAPATTRAASGAVQRQLFYKGSVLPQDVPAHEIQHLLSVNLISPVAAPIQRAAASPAAVANDEVTQPGGGSQQPPDGGGVESDGEAAEARAEARAKLEAAGGKPTGRHGQPVWAEYLVSKGYDYDLVAKESKEGLQRLAEGLND